MKSLLYCFQNFEFICTKNQVHKSEPCYSAQFFLKLLEIISILQKLSKSTEINMIRIGCIHEEIDTHTKNPQMQPKVAVNGHTFRWNKDKEHMFIYDLISKKL